jgi:hypothetical protein
MSKAKRRNWAFLACCLAAGGLALMGCRSEEQNRIKRFEKGTYLGNPDQKLDQEQVDELRHRARSQRG